MDHLTDQGIEKELVWRNFSLSLPVGTDFFLEIAKLKALRILWYQVAQAFDVTNFSTGRSKHSCPIRTLDQREISTA